MSKVLLFSAGWCAPCVEMITRLNSIENDVVVIDIDDTKGCQQARSMGIQGVPTLVRLDADGEPTEVSVGLLTEGQLHEFLGK